nr:AMP-binding protein [Sphingomonas sp.]
MPSSKDALARHRAATPDKLAVLMADGSAALTYEQLDAEAWRIAHALRDRNLRDGATIALLLDNHSRVLTWWWGARRAGLYYIPLSTKLTPAEIAYILDDAGVKLLIADDANSCLARDAAAAARDTAHVVEVDAVSLTGLGDFGALAAAMTGRELIYSSGTTGRPRGIRRPLAPAVDDAPLPALERRMRALFEIDARTIYLSVAPLYHATGRFLNRVVEEGGTAVILPMFDARDALAAVARHRVTHTQWVPTMFVRLLALDEPVRHGYDLSSHRVALHAAAPCPEPVKRRMIEWWGPILHEYYGGSENAGVTFIRAEEWLARPGSVGQSITGAIHILDERSRQPLPPGETGEILFEGGVPFTYLGEERGTSDLPNGLAGYGDLGWVDADGYLYISDRRSDLIITGGVNVYPSEVESVLDADLEVAESAVVGLSDPEYGQRVVAFVVPMRSLAARQPLAAALLGRCRAQLSGIKCPREIRFVDQLPRNENGKVLKRVLRDLPE